MKLREHLAVWLVLCCSMVVAHGRTVEAQAFLPAGVTTELESSPVDTATTQVGCPAMVRGVSRCSSCSSCTAQQRTHSCVWVPCKTVQHMRKRQRAGRALELCLFQPPTASTCCKAERQAHLRSFRVRCIKLLQLL